jgi:hypothetical protein
MSTTGIEMKPEEIRTHRWPGDPQPMELAGAGPLMSSIWKLGGEQSGWRYRFSIVRRSMDRSHFTDLFQPNDLIHFIKLIQVLAAVITADGCLTLAERTMLTGLVVKLDEFLGFEPFELNEDTTTDPQHSLHND